MRKRSTAWRAMCSSKDNKAVDASELLKQMDLLDLVEGAKHGGPKFLIQFTCDADKSICTQEEEDDYEDEEEKQGPRRIKILMYDDEIVRCVRFFSCVTQINNI